MFALVTGASGFLGGHLVQRLRDAGHRVRALVRDPRKARFLEGAGIEVIQGDVTVPASLTAALDTADVVFHSAALVGNWAPWAAFQATSVQGTQNMLDAAVRAGVERFVHVSTIRVYDDRYCRQHPAVAEDAPIGPRGFRAFGNYARAKALAERAVWGYRERLPVTVIRPAWIYGPRDEMILPGFVRWLCAADSRWPGRCDPCADPIYVTDVADCAIAAATHANAVGQAYNVSPHRRICLREFLGALCARLGIKMPDRAFPYAGAVLFTHLYEWWARLTFRRSAPSLNYAGLAILTQDVRHDPTKSERELGWRSQVEIADGLDHTVRWLKEERPDLLPC